MNKIKKSSKLKMTKIKVDNKKWENIFFKKHQKKIAKNYTSRKSETQCFFFSKKSKNQRKRKKEKEASKGLPPETAQTIFSKKKKSCKKSCGN